jgi:hypothetical protein
MEFLTQLLAAGGPVSIGIAAIFLLMLLAIKIIWETGKEERKARVEAEARFAVHHESVIKQMFEVVNTNTKAITTNTEVTRELSTSIRESRLANSPQ